MLQQMLSVLQNTAAGNTNTLLLATTATAAVVFTARQKKLRLVQKWLLAAMRRRQKKGNASIIILGFLALLLGIAAIVGIFYFAAIGNYLMVLVSAGIVLAIVFLAAYGGSKGKAVRRYEKSKH